MRGTPAHTSTVLPCYTDINLHLVHSVCESVTHVKRALWVHQSPWVVSSTGYLQIIIHLICFRLSTLSNKDCVPFILMVHNSSDMNYHFVIMLCNILNTLFWIKCFVQSLLSRDKHQRQRCNRQQENWSVSSSAIISWHYLADDVVKFHSILTIHQWCQCFLFINDFYRDFLFSVGLTSPNTYTITS